MASCTASARTLRRRRVFGPWSWRQETGAPPQVAPSRGGGPERALLALPEAFRTAVVLRDVEDFTYEEIARILAVPIGTVMSRIHRGRALLRQALGGSRP